MTRFAGLRSVRLAAVALALAGVGWFLLGVAWAPALYLLLRLDPTVPIALPPLRGIGLAVLWVVLACIAPLAHAAVVWGLWRGRRWAWGVAVGLGVIYTPSGCLPLGLVVLKSLLARDVRDAFR